MKSNILTALTLSASIISGTANAANERVYFGTSDSQGIYFADFDPDSGQLTPPKLALTIPRPGFIAIHPSNKYIYCTTPGGRGSKESLVAALKVKDDGTLELINKQPAGGQGSCHVSIDATGKCLMVAHYGSGGVASLQILDDGSLSPVRSAHQHEGSGANAKRQQGPHAHSIFTSPDNRFAYAPDLGIDKVMIYALDAKSGTLTEAGFSAVPGGGMGPRHMKWSADGQYAYVLNELDLSVSVFKPGTSPGSLEHITTCSTLPDGADKEGMSCSEIRIHPNGNFVYAATRDVTGQHRDSIAVFSSYENGFQRIETVPAEVDVPRNFNIDPSGKWMLVGGEKSHDIAIFKVDPQTGKITFTETKVPFDGGPICIEFAR